RATGGLADTVREFDPITREGNGFVFEHYSGDEMVMALRRALAIWNEPDTWRLVQKNGMLRDSSWRVAADGYDRLYEEARERVESGRVQSLDTVADSF
ncbi:MAG: hypothetical protein K8R56_09205, partial [Candidatus Eisenbacteria bacterium]|nr:hypothetical protein [Candidatus Eisenbacteria bacterium]